MLRIGIYTYSTKPRGSVVHATSLAEALTEAGHEVTVHALAKPGEPMYRNLACAVHLIPAQPAPADPDALIRQRIDEFVRGFRAHEMHHDVFHAQDCLAASALLVDRSRRTGPVVRTVHHVERFDSAYLANCQRRSILEADAVLSVSRLTQREVYEQFGRRAQVVHNGVDPRRFAIVHEEARARWRSRLAPADDDTIVLSVGGIEPRKNSLGALAAFARACESHPRLRWVIAGGHSIWDHSEYVAEFENHLARLSTRVAARVTRTGTVSDADMASLLVLSDIMLCSSVKEGFGLSVLEAMAAGAAVVVPEHRPFTEYLDASAAAFFEPGSIDGMAGALTRLAVDRELCNALAAAAKRRARRWSWARSAEMHLRHYASVRRLAGARPEFLEGPSDA